MRRDWIEGQHCIVFPGTIFCFQWPLGRKILHSEQLVALNVYRKLRVAGSF